MGQTGNFVSAIISRNALWSLLLFIVLVAGTAVFAQAPAEGGVDPISAAQQAIPEQQVQTRLVADTSAVVPGKSFRLAVELKMLPGWHTYYKEAGEAGMPTKITWELPEGFTASDDLLWQKPSRFSDAGITTFGYENKTVVGATITAPANVKQGTVLKFGAKVKWLACKDVCVPGKASLTIELPAGSSAQPANAETFSGLGWVGDVQTLPEAHGGGSAAKPIDTPFSGSILDKKITVAGGEGQLNLAAYLGLAFVGGFILNFMPCVLPVISIKLLGLMQEAGAHPQRVLRLGTTFAAGIMAAFLALAGVLVVVQQAGQQVGWGFQFQYPLFLLIMSAVVLIFALSLFGLFYIQFSAGQDNINALADHDGYSGTFFKGVLATTLSTPCSAPFLGTALGFAFAQPPYMVMLMFATIGVGMAFPYVLLTARPAWMKYLPRPGVWMEKFKESMGFLLLATVVWLIWVLAQQVGINAAMAAVGFLLAISFAVWLVGRFTDLTSSTGRKAIVYSCALAIVAGGYLTMLKPYPELLSMAPAVQPVAAPTPVASSPYAVASNVTESIDWQPFSIDSLNAQLAAGKTVFLDFTADWCLTCKVNENTVIAAPQVVNKARELGVTMMRADWTRQDPTITRLLQKFGRSGVPLYVIFPAGRPEEPLVLPEVITVDMLVAKLGEAGPSR